MNRRIGELTKQLEFEHGRLERTIRPVERNIKNIEQEIEKVNKEFVALVIDNIINEITAIRYAIENWEYFNFDGYFINRAENSVVLYITDKQMNRYEIIIEKCEFKYNDKNGEEEFADEMETVLRELNEVFAFD